MSIKIGFLTQHDPSDRNSFSGVIYSIFETLNNFEDTRVEIIPHSVIKQKGFVSKVLHWPLKKPFFKNLYGKIKIRNYVHQSRKLINNSKGKLDVIISPVSSEILGRLDLSSSSPPIIYITDATSKFLEEEYGREFQKEKHDFETRSINAARLVVYSSEYMLNRAREEYAHIGIQDKSCYIAFGINIESISSDRIRKKALTKTRVSLLFIGKIDWERKGGETAIQVVSELRNKGVNAELTIIGCNPESAQAKEWIHIYPYLDKNIESQKTQFQNLINNSHFLILPTRADCNPIVIGECYSFAVPALTTNVGGIPSLVRQNETGIMFDRNDGADSYVNAVMELLESPGKYEMMCTNARNLFEEKLNWNAWGREILNRIHQLE